MRFSNWSSLTERLNIPYMVAGSFASSFFGLARITEDADLIVSMKAEQVERFIESFQHDFYLARGMVAEALEKGRAFNIIHFESSFKVDFFVLGHGRFAQEEFSRRQLRRLARSSHHYFRFDP